jgi:DNA-binding transcriptional LysR family regulator
LKVLEEGSFSRAADAVCRTQPAVSIAIRRLEEEIQAPLFDRSQKTPTLTAAGQVVREYAEKILALRDQARETVDQLRSLQQGRVRVGANESTSLYLLPQLILTFRDKHPDVRVELYRHSSERLPREVLDNNVDFALLAFEPVDRDLESFCVLKDELVLILNPAHPLAQNKSVTVNDLGNESFVAHNVRTASRKKVMEFFASHQVPLHISFEHTIETIKKFVQLNIGPAFVPRMCVRDELERGSLVTVPVEGLTYYRTLWVTNRRNGTFSHAAAAFLKLLRAKGNTIKARRTK